MNFKFRILSVVQKSSMQNSEFVVGSCEQPQKQSSKSRKEISRYDLQFRPILAAPNMDWWWCSGGFRGMTPHEEGEAEGVGIPPEGP